MYLIQEPLKILGPLCHERGERPGRERRTDPVPEHLRGTRIGQMLVGQEVHAQSPDPGAVLRRGRDRGREYADRLVPARAAPPVRAVLADPQADLR